ncbi:hypothetical protein PFISCL1PPCAC_27948, partial [Pristionchus fissidentatus]
MTEEFGPSRIRTAMFKQVLRAMHNVLLSAKCVQDEGTIYENPIVLEELFTSLNTILVEDESFPFEPQQKEMIDIAQAMAFLLDRMQGIRLRICSSDEMANGTV